MRKAFIYKQIRLNLAWDQAPHRQRWRKKTKSTSEANREVVCGGERVVALPPSPGYRSARFARRYFPIWPLPFWPFFPHCGAWSQASLDQFFEEVFQRSVWRNCIWTLGHIRLNYFFLGVGRLSRVIEKTASILTTLLGFSCTHPCFSDIVSDLLRNFFNSLLK